MERSTGKRGRPALLSDDMLGSLQGIYGCSDKRKAHNMYYFSKAITILEKYQSIIPNYEYFINDRTHTPRQCVLTELGRLYQMFANHYEEGVAILAVVEMAQQIGELSKDNLLTTRMAEKIVRQKRLEIYERLKNKEDLFK